MFLIFAYKKICRARRRDRVEVLIIGKQYVIILSRMRTAETSVKNAAMDIIYSKRREKKRRRAELRIGDASGKFVFYVKSGEG